MVQVQWIDAPAFWVTGVKTRILATHEFSRFWKASHDNGTVSALKGLQETPGNITASHILGVSRVEADPSNRVFDFYIATEHPETSPLPEGMERFLIPACTWAVCTGEVQMLDALYEAEMYAFGTLLQDSGYLHAPAPELEVYPADGGTVQFWMPILWPVV